MPRAWGIVRGRALNYTRPAQLNQLDSRKSGMSVPFAGISSQSRLGRCQRGAVSSATVLSRNSTHYRPDNPARRNRFPTRSRVSLLRVRVPIALLPPEDSLVPSRGLGLT